MELNGLFYPDDWSTWAWTHDVVLDVTDCDLTIEECELLFHSLPSTIRSEALEFGFSDTCYGEALRVHLESHDDCLYVLRGGSCE